MGRLIRPILDLTRNAWKQRHGDITVHGTWYWDEDDRQWVPCLALVPAASVLHFERVQPCLVPVDHAWAWSEEQGGWPYVAQTALTFAAALGMPPDTKSVIRVAALIRDHIEDLVKRVPPRPPDSEETIITADAVAKIDGRSQHTEVRDRV
jgi:hypothetical protein